MTDKTPSRLDREIDEILQKSRETPLRLDDYRVSAAKKKKSAVDFGVLRNSWERITRMPLLLAFIFAVLARVVVGVSPLLALLLCTASVASIWIPALMGLRSATVATTETKFWRGRPYTTTQDIVSQSPIQSIKNYFDRRR